MLRLFFALCVTLLPALPSSAQDTSLPALHVTDWILGDPDDVGTWGDGRVYVLDLWGTWCSPCIENIPNLTRLQDAYKDRGLVVVGYSWEAAETLRPFVAQMGDRMRYVVVSDTAEVTIGALAERGEVQGFPYAFLVDATGTVVWKGHPEDDDLGGAVARLFTTR